MKKFIDKALFVIGILGLIIEVSFIVFLALILKELVITALYTYGTHFFLKIAIYSVVVLGFIIITIQDITGSFQKIKIRIGIDIDWLRNRLGPLSNVVSIIEENNISLENKDLDLIFKKEIQKSKMFLKNIRENNKPL